MTDDYADERRRLLEILDEEFRGTARWTGPGGLNPAVRKAMASVPRHEFVPRWERPFAYANRPLSIGRGQTISQPYVVAAMTQMLRLEQTSRVLEVGTGCGYQAAVLGLLAAAVWSIERIPELAESAAQRLARLGYANVHVRCGDGSLGWPEQAPFDGVIVTAAAAEIPAALVEQLARGGRMAIPVGAAPSAQVLTLVERDDAGVVTVTPGLPVAFVPLITG